MLYQFMYRFIPKNSENKIKYKEIQLCSYIPEISHTFFYLVKLEYIYIFIFIYIW